MNYVYQAPEYGDNSQTLKCTANEVSGRATDLEGPETCELNSKVKVNVTASLTFNTERFDVGLYTYTGSRAGYDQLQDEAALKGDQCAFQTLVPSDQCSPPGNSSDNGVYDVDGDECCDVVAQSGYTFEGFRFQDNLEVPCVSAYGTSQLVLQTCFSWRQGADGGDCPANASLPLYSWPGTSSKCECTFIELNVTVKVCFPLLIFHCFGISIQSVAHRPTYPFY